MRNCIRCGSSLGDFDAGGDGICANCEASSGHGSGTPTDVPCQRCGMYLPPHELRMWNSRLYCAYCIMDIQDEEKYGHQKHKPEEHGGGLFGGDGNLPQGSKPSSGTCERCGRQTDALYSLSGRRVCAHCYSEEGAGAGAGSGGSILSQIIIKAKEAFGMGPKISANAGAQNQSAGLPANRGAPSSPASKFQPQGETSHERVFSIKDRSMVFKDGRKSEPRDGGAVGGVRGESGQDSAAPGVFDVRSRKMVEKKNAIESSEPISEGKRKDKKPSPRAKKFFFGMHPSEKGGKK